MYYYFETRIVEHVETAGYFGITNQIDGNSSKSLKNNQNWAIFKRAALSCRINVSLPGTFPRRGRRVTNFR